MFRDEGWMDLFATGKGDVDGAGELAVDCFQLGVDFAKESLGNRMLQAEKVV